MTPDDNDDSNTDTNVGADPSSSGHESQRPVADRPEARRRCPSVALSERARRHPFGTAIGAGVAGLVVGAIITAAVFAITSTPAITATNIGGQTSANTPLRPVPRGRSRRAAASSDARCASLAADPVWAPARPTGAALPGACAAGAIASAATTAGCAVAAAGRAASSVRTASTAASVRAASTCLRVHPRRHRHRRSRRR